MKTIRGYVYNRTTNEPIENVVVSNSVPEEIGTQLPASQIINTLTNGVGEFTLSVPDNQEYLTFYKVGTGTGGMSFFYIPQPTPAVWNVGLNAYSYADVVIRPDKPTTKKMWPYYALGGLALILLIRKMSKSKKG
jgi:hypothetical protein